MRKVKLYIGISLDGRIAKPDGNLDWLHAVSNPQNTDHGYAEFISSIDTTLMGNHTYREVLSFGVEWPYAGKTNYVFTRQANMQDNEQVQFITGDIPGFVSSLKAQEGKDIWLIGGGEVNTLLLNAGLIDEMQVFVMPVVIGKGIAVFEGDVIETHLKLKDVLKYSSGAVRLTYVK